MKSINPQVNEFQKESLKLEGKSQEWKKYTYKMMAPNCVCSLWKKAVGAGEINVLVPSWVSELQPVCRTSVSSLLCFIAWCLATSDLAWMKRVFKQKHYLMFLTWSCPSCHPKVFCYYAVFMCSFKFVLFQQECLGWVCGAMAVWSEATFRMTVL